jgi:hypothetical protein
MRLARGGALYGGYGSLSLKSIGGSYVVFLATHCSINYQQFLAVCQGLCRLKAGLGTIGSCLANRRIDLIQLFTGFSVCAFGK